MTKLETLYNSIRGLKELGLPLNEETLKAVDQLEEELIKNDVIPRLSDSIEPIITKIERPIVLVVDYIPGENLSVRLTRKRVITDEKETKQYPLSAERKEAQEKIYETNEKAKKRKTERTMKFSNKSKKTRLSVKFPDGTTIENSYAYETFIDVILKIGVEKVSELNMKWVGLPLVSKEKDDFYNQHETENGWWIVTHSSTNQKRLQLEEMSKKLKLNLDIEII